LLASPATRPGREGAAMPQKSSIILTPEPGGLRLARERAGLSKRRLAQAAGVSRATVRAYETKADPELTPTFVRIANAISASAYGNGGDPLAARMDALEGLFDQLLEIVTGLARRLTEGAA
jgi:transcriptional regulator with XRE-family HTH domain